MFSAGGLKMVGGNTFHILFDDPLIAYVPMNKKTNATVSFLAERAGGKPFYVILSPSWALSKTLETRWGEFQASTEAYPQMTPVMLAQTPDDCALIEAIGIESILCSHNALLDEEVIYPETGSEVLYDAVYVARLNRFKRHHLAYLVRNIAVVSAKFGVKPDEAAELIAGYVSLSFSNYDPDAGIGVLSVPEVRTLLSQSRCGLALSAAEGAMFAAGEYGLAGLPIVSTPSIGGRDQFFHEDWVTIVEPDPVAVSGAVASYQFDAPDRAFIRTRTLDLMRPHRLNLIAWLEKALGRSLTETARPTGWLPQFVHRMHVWHSFS